MGEGLKESAVFAFSLVVASCRETWGQQLRGVRHSREVAELGQKYPFPHPWCISAKPIKGLEAPILSLCGWVTHRGEL
jgi:hypothetical protein